MVDATRQISLFKDGWGCLGREAAVLRRVDKLALARLERFCHFSHIGRFRRKFRLPFAIFESQK